MALTGRVEFPRSGVDGVGFVDVGSSVSEGTFRFSARPAREDAPQRERAAGATRSGVPGPSERPPPRRMPRDNARVDSRNALVDSPNALVDSPDAPVDSAMTLVDSRHSTSGLRERTRRLRDETSRVPTLH